MFLTMGQKMAKYNLAEMCQKEYLFFFALAAITISLSHNLLGAKSKMIMEELRKNWTRGYTTKNIK